METKEVNYSLLKKNVSVCFTGHRSQKLPWKFNETAFRCKIMKFRLYRIIMQVLAKGYKRFYCGMAIGFDTICAETLLKIKFKCKKYSDIEIIGALPCRNQDCKWNNEARNRYRNILKKLDGIRCIYENYNGKICMHERNRFMVNNSSLMIALFDGISGGTKSTVDYARKKGLEIIVIKP